MKKGLSLILLLLVVQAAWAQKFTATLSQRTVSLNDNLQVSFSLENASGENFTPPDFSDFLVLGGPSTSTNMQIVNGRMSRSVSYSYYLRPKKVGTFTIGPAIITVDGKQVKSNSLSVTVKEGAAGEDDLMSQIGQNVFLRAVADKREVYQGEQVTVTFKLYQRMQLSINSVDQRPSYSGFWKEELQPLNVQNYQREVYKGLSTMWR